MKRSKVEPSALAIFPARIPSRLVKAEPLGADLASEGAAGGWNPETDIAAIPIGASAYERNVRRHESLHALYSTGNPLEIAQDNGTSIFLEQGLEDMRLHAHFSKAEAGVRRDEIASALLDLRSILSQRNRLEPVSPDAALICRVMLGRAAAILGAGVSGAKLGLLRRAARAGVTGLGARADKYVTACLNAAEALEAAPHGHKAGARELLRPFFPAPRSGGGGGGEGEGEGGIGEPGEAGKGKGKAGSGGLKTSGADMDAADEERKAEAARAGSLRLFKRTPQPEPEPDSDSDGEPGEGLGADSEASTVTASKPRAAKPSSVKGSPAKPQPTTAGASVKVERGVAAGKESVLCGVKTLEATGLGQFVPDKVINGLKSMHGNLVPVMEVHHLANTYGSRKIFKGKNARAAYTGARIAGKRLAGAAVSPGGEVPVFLRKLPGQFGGTILIDASGSMDIGDNLLIELAESCPMGTVAYYSGEHDSVSIKREARGHLCIYAEQQRRYIPGSAPRGPRMGCYTLPFRFGGNLIDLGALQWLLKQPGPRYFMTDCGFTGSTEHANATRALLTAAKVRRLVIHLRSIDELREVITSRGKVRAGAGSPIMG